MVHDLAPRVLSSDTLLVDDLLLSAYLSEAVVDDPACNIMCMGNLLVCMSEAVPDGKVAHELIYSFIMLVSASSSDSSIWELATTMCCLMLLSSACGTQTV